MYSGDFFQTVGTTIALVPLGYKVKYCLVFPSIIT